LSKLKVYEWFRSKWWIFVGILGYYLACSFIGGFIYFFAFLAGVAFGSFCVQEQYYKRKGRDHFIGLYFVLGFPGFIIAWSGLFSSYNRVGLLLVVGLIFVWTSLRFARKAYIGIHVSLRMRMSIIFGPILSGILTAVATFVKVFVYYDVMADSSLQIAGLFLIATIPLLFISIFCFALSERSTVPTPPQPKQHAG
jgi:hypothetical protein